MKTRVFTVVEICIVCVILLLLTFMAVSAWDKMRHSDERDHFTFAAWSKQTGNPKNLTFEEWRALAKMHEPEADRVIIIHQP